MLTLFSLSYLVYFYLEAILGCPNQLKPIVYKFQNNMQLSLSWYTFYMKEEDLEKLNFEGTITSFTISLSGNFTSINVRNQDINFLCKKLFDITGEINGISLDFCKIKEIERNCFSEVNVRIITINNNQISRIKKHTFGNAKIEVINLAENQIEKIENEAFYNLTNLQQLLLNDNKLKVINPELFFNMPNLEYLQLNNNEIESINANFLHLSELEKIFINLHGNKIVQVDPNAFNKIGAKKIDLSLFANYLTYLPDYIFENHHFAKIDLTKNPLSDISTNLCTKCTIDVITLDNDVIKNLSQTFWDWAKSKNVRITSNNLRKLKSGNKRFGVSVVIIGIVLVFNNFVH